MFTHKARLVAKGYKQIHGMDCVETSCIMVMLKSINQAMIAYWYIWHLDDKTIPQSNDGINYVHGMS